MSKRVMIGLLTLVFVLSFSKSVFAAPSKLVAVPFSSQENNVVVDWGVELSWEKGAGDETYDVWLSKNGTNWERISSSVSGSTYMVNKDKINLYVNYYFMVVLSDPNVVNPLTETNLDENNPDATNIAIAFPPGGGVHGNYKNNTNSCAKCHRTHDTDGPALLIEATVNDTCMTCHDGTTSKYDVLRGEVKGPNSSYLISASGAFGGIFGSKSLRTMPASVMSIHPVDENVTLKNALRFPQNFTGEEWDKTLGCNSCHSLHGSDFVERDNSVYTATYKQFNYRMLARKLPGYSDIKVLAFAETDTANNTETINYQYGVNQFCTGCHVDSIETVSGDVYAVMGKTSTPTRHAIDVPLTGYSVSSDTYHSQGEGGTVDLQTTLPLQGPEIFENYNNNKIMCLTCHSSHGSENEKLLRQPGTNGVCLDCHVP